MIALAHIVNHAMPKKLVTGGHNINILTVEG